MSVIVSELLDHYSAIRLRTTQLAEGLSAEDLAAQSMPDASPGKWHLAHTTWFFETFILQKFCQPFAWFDAVFPFLFNSYYDSVGERHTRPQRGLLTRPSLQTVLEYRAHVDRHMERLLHERPQDIAQLVTIGLHHEMQHQELFLTDILHLFSHNPLRPGVLASLAPAASSAAAVTPDMQRFEGGLLQVGATPKSDSPWQSFSYDCEQPRHSTYVSPFSLATRLVTNEQWQAFIDDGGYREPLLWLSDGWARCQQEQWHAPLYWQWDDGQWSHFTLSGQQAVRPQDPVSHVSYYEADAFARWSGKRLPREHEWEHVAAQRQIEGNFLETHLWQPRPFSGQDFADMYGDVWEWTQSAFSPYPGFQAKQGALGEYNGKFMLNQCVLRGGSCVTPHAQMRASYRNFFYPHQRWQFSGVRLAEDS